MKTCIAIAIRFEETLIVQEHSTLKYGTFLGLKKRGNCTQLLEKTFREGKGPNHFSFLFFFLPSSSLLPHHLSHQNFPSILSIKNRSNQPMILENSPFPSTNRYIIAPTISLLSFTPSPCFYNFAPIFLSSETYITFSFSFLTPSQASRDAKCVCFPSTDRTLSSSPPSENVSSRHSLSFSLSLLHRESTPRVYLSHNRNESRYLYIRRHMGPYGRKESGDRRWREEGACMTPLKIQTSDTSNK